MSKKGLSEEVVAKIRNMRAEGHTYDEISKTVKVSVASVARYSKSNSSQVKRAPGEEVNIGGKTMVSYGTPCVVRQDSKRSEPYNGVVKHYIPDYRREIQPKVTRMSYEYGGLEFSIGGDEIKFNNLIAKIVDICNPIESDDYEIPGTITSTSELKANLYSIRDLINVGEALVGIGLFFERSEKE